MDLLQDQQALHEFGGGHLAVDGQEQFMQGQKNPHLLAGNGRQLPCPGGKEDGPDVFRAPPCPLAVKPVDELFFLRCHTEFYPMIFHDLPCLVATLAFLLS